MRKTRKLDKNYKMQEIKRRQAINDDYRRALSFVVVLVIIIALLALLYFLNGKYVSKDLFQDETTTTTTEAKYDPSKILAANIFDIDDKEYMVLLYDSKDDKEAVLYTSSVNAYTSEDVPLYTVDLGNKMNKNYYDQDGKENTKPTKASEVMVTRSTLMVIKKGKVTSYITEPKDILAKLKVEEDED